MEQQDHPSEQHPILCAKQCGFFGNPMFQNMCSKCFKEHQKEQQQQDNVPAMEPAQPMESANTPVPAEQSSAAIQSDPAPVIASPTAEVKAVESAAAVTHDAVAEPSSTAEVSAANATDDKPAELPKQVRKDRCYQCKVKLTLAKQISNQCRCGFIYCDSHRHSHECGFDHQQRQQEVLTALNPKVAMKTGGRSFNRLE